MGNAAPAPAAAPTGAAAGLALSKPLVQAPHNNAMGATTPRGTSVPAGPMSPAEVSSRHEVQTSNGKDRLVRKHPTLHTLSVPLQHGRDMQSECSI